MLMRPSELEGKNVIGTGGKVVGTVSGIEFEPLSWKVNRLAVRLSDDAIQTLGYKKPFLGHVEILISVDAVKGVADVITLDKSVSELRSAIEPPK
jgi:sporulation protein YlmC with PRC-barrel domain